jgi:hypothetical protein
MYHQGAATALDSDVARRSISGVEAPGSTAAGAYGDGPAVPNRTAHTESAQPLNFEQPALAAIAIGLTWQQRRTPDPVHVASALSSPRL